MKLCKITILYSTFFCLLFLPLASHAETVSAYPPGTIGYLIDDCRAAIQKDTLEELWDTPCYRILNAYMMGGFAANMKNHNPPPDRQFKTTKACEPLIEKARQKMWDEHSPIFCPQNPDETMNLGLYMIYLIANGGQWLEKHDKDMLVKPLLWNIDEVLGVGPYCRHIANSKNPDQYLHPNQKLLDISGKAWNAAEYAWKKEHKEKDNPFEYQTCIQDIEKSGNDNARFIGTECGMYSSAFLSGLVISKVKEKITDPTGVCTTELDRYYKYEVLAEDICLPENIDVLDLAKRMQTKNEDAMNYCKKK
jgi:hypothetical protein